MGHWMSVIPQQYPRSSLKELPYWSIKMPAKSKAQQRFMGAELKRKRAGKRTKTKMSETQLKEFASTKRKGLPARKKKK